MTHRFLLPLVLGLAGFASSVQGAAYSTTFDAFNPALDVAGQDGWTINDSTANLSFIANLNGSPAAALGGFFDAPALTAVELTHPYGLSLSGSSFDVDFDVEPSTAAFPGRDSFGFSFKDGASGLLMSIILKPNINVANQLEVLWQGPTGAPISTANDIIETGFYHLDINFGSSGADGTFNAQLTPLVGAPLIWNGSLTGAGAATIATFGADFDVTTGTGGDNIMLFDNIGLVPEPSSALLIGLGLAAAIRRRRTV